LQEVLSRDIPAHAELSVIRSHVAMLYHRLEPKGNLIYEYQTPTSPVVYEEAWVQQPYDHGLIAYLTLRSTKRPDDALAAQVESWLVHR
jgi:hypothetical protein